MLSAATVKAAIPRRDKAVGRRAFLQAAAIANTGSRIECPICGKKMRKFARFHGVNDQCSRCTSLMRHRAFLLYLRDVYEIGRRGGDVLHSAPSRGLKNWLVSRPGVRYTSVDLDSPVADMHADLTALPFADASYDLVICAHVLEHIPDDRAAIAEIHRVLRPGGTALLQVPPSDLDVTFEDATATMPDERERLYGQYDHVRICGADYGRRMEEAGFEVRLEDPVEGLDVATRERHGLRTGEPFYLCVKPGDAQ